MPAYEVTNGDSLAAVESYCRHLCGTAGFGTATHPTLQEVQGFGDMGYYKIAGALTNAGYSTTQTAAGALGWLQTLQSLETVISLELAYPITGAGEPNERFAEFVRQRDWFYAMLLDGNVLGPDAVVIRELGAYTTVTGVSIERKRSVREDSDLVPHRFRRGWGTNPSGYESRSADPLA